MNGQAPVHLCPNVGMFTYLCGKFPLEHTDHMMTLDLSRVTCPDCLQELIKQYRDIVAEGVLRVAPIMGKAQPSGHRKEVTGCDCKWCLIHRWIKEVAKALRGPVPE